MAILVSKGNCYRWTIDVSRWAKQRRRHIPICFIPAYGSNGSLPGNWIITKLIKEPLVFRLHSFAADRRRDLFEDWPPSLIKATYLGREGGDDFDLELRPTDHALIVSSFFLLFPFFLQKYIYSFER